MKFSYLIIVLLELVICSNTFGLKIIDLTNNNHNNDIKEQNDQIINQNYDFNYLLSNALLDYPSTTTPSKLNDDIFEIPISNTNNQNYDYEFVINQYDETTPATLNEHKKLIYIPVDYSIEFRKDKIEYSTRKPTTLLSTLLLRKLINSTKFNSNITNLNQSNLTWFNSTTYLNTTTSITNITKIQNTTIYSVLNLKNSTDISNRTTLASNRVNTTTEKKSSFEKTFLKLESTFDEMYDIDSISRKHGMIPSVAHLIEKRIHNHNEKMSDNTKDTDYDKRDNELYHHHHHYHNYNTGHALDTITFMQFLYIAAALFLFAFFIFALIFCRKNTTAPNLSLNN